MKNQKFRQWYNRKALLAGVLAVSMAVSPMTTAFAGTGAQTAVATQEQEAVNEVVLADFNFDEAAEDGSFNGGNAIATVGGGSIELVDHDGGKAAKFVASDKDWLQVTKADGSSLLDGYEEVTISYDILPEMSNSHWVFYAAQNGNSLNWNDNGNKERYLGVLVKNGNTEIERYNNTGSRPTNPTIKMTASQWQHVDIVYTKDATVAYLNGVRVSKVASSYSLKDILGNNGVFWLGKAAWGGGEYSSMQLDNFKIVAGTSLYDNDRVTAATSEIETALGDIDNVIGDLNLIQTSSDGLSVTWTSDNTDIVTADGKVTIPTDGNKEVTLTAIMKDGDKTVGEKTYKVTVLDQNAMLNELADQLTLPYSTESGSEVYGNITLPETIGAADVTWSTKQSDIVDVNSHEVAGYDAMPAGVVTRPEKDTDVTLTATITWKGLSTTKDFTFTVKAAPEKIEESDYTDYFFAYFAGEGYSDGEQIYFASSQDGMNWDDLNNNNPILTSALGEKGVRDPFIIRSPEGDKFYLIATDLKINGGNGWDAAQNNGSQSLMIWESTDLVNWSDERMVEVSADIGAGCTWAPEATYDAKTGEYVVYWASRTPEKDTKQRLYYAKTRDFYTFTEPQLYIDYDQSSIDTTMIENNGTYYRFTKNEGGSTNSLGAKTKTIFLEKSDSVLGNFTQIASDSLNSNQYVEGPTIFKLNQDDTDGTDKWCLLVDDFGGSGYYPLVTTDLESGVFTKPESGTYKMPSRARHGTPIRVTSEEYKKIMAAYSSPDTVTATAIMGQEPQLPDTVTVNGEEKNVTWNLDGVSFTGTPYSYVTVTGSVEGSIVAATAQVQLIPDNVEYMIDSNNTGSKTWENVKAVSDKLLNTNAADQAKTEDNSWGYTSVVGDSGDIKGYSQVSETNPYAGGWWARSNKNITYQVTLPKGEHQIMLGCTGWWSMGRAMDVYYSVNGGAEIKLCDFDAVKSSETYAEGTIELTEDAVVTLTVKKAASDDPILSWISISDVTKAPEISTDALQAKVDAAKAYEADKADYTSGSYGAVEAAVKAAEALIAEPTSQEEVDAAAEAIQKALDALVSIKDLKASYAANQGKDADAYTEDSYKAYTDALAQAKEVLENADATAEQVEAALTGLEKAVAGLTEKTPDPDPTPDPTPTPEPTYTNGLSDVPAADGNWYYYQDGKIATDLTTVTYNKYGWFYVHNGKVDFNYNGLAANEYGWWKISGGAVDFNFNGMAANEYGWWKISGGAVDFNYNGLAANEYGWWKITGGAVDFNYNGLAANEYGWWKITGGAVDFTYNGVVANEAGYWYVRGGAIDFSFSGKVSVNGSIRNVKNGKVSR